jgi:hypothetical protein
VRWLAVALSLGACATGPVTGRDAGELPFGLSIGGRVLDAESCSMRCEAVTGAVVTYEPAARTSMPTGPDGAFSVSGLPDNSVIDLLVDGPSFAVTLNPEVAHTVNDDLYGAQVYVLPSGPGSLLAAIEEEVGPGAIHVGQVVVAEGLALTAVEGAAVAMEPPVGSIRIVNVLPRLGTGEPALKPPSETETGRFGMYVVVGGSGPVTIRVTAAGRSFEPVTTTMESGRSSYTLHQGT